MTVPTVPIYLWKVGISLKNRKNSQILGQFDNFRQTENEKVHKEQELEEAEDAMKEKMEKMKQEMDEKEEEVAALR